jgi:hypothetical protein
LGTVIVCFSTPALVGVFSRSFASTGSRSFSVTYTSYSPAGTANERLIR